MYRKRNNLLDVMALFTCGYDKRFFLREISRLAKMPLKTTQAALACLEKDSILKSKVEGKNKYFFLNKESLIAKNTLLQAEIHKTIKFLVANPQITLFAKEIASNTSILVFGSFAKGTARTGSDMDLLITGKKDDLPLHLLPFKEHVIEISEKDLIFSVKSDVTLIKEVEEHHVILNNHSLFVNVFWQKHGKQKNSMVLQDKGRH